MTLTDSDVATYGNLVADYMQTQNMAATNPAPGPANFPYAYYEWTYRFDIDESTIGGIFWSWVGGNAQTLAGAAPDYLVEVDFDEIHVNGGSGNDSAFNKFAPGGSQTTEIFASNFGLPPTSYHTVGVLLTGDGGTNFSGCTYLDGVRSSCGSWTYDTANENLQRRFLLVGGPTYNGSGSIGTVHLYVTNIKVLTCANWTSAAPSGMCPGSAFNGNFYHP